VIGGADFPGGRRLQDEPAQRLRPQQHAGRERAVEGEQIRRRGVRAAGRRPRTGSVRQFVVPSGL